MYFYVKWMQIIKNKEKKSGLNFFKRCYDLGAQLESACLAWFNPQHHLKHNLKLHICNPSTLEMDSGKPEIQSPFYYIDNWRPSCDTWDPG